jgi:hypothetical protein
MNFINLTDGWAFVTIITAISILCITIICIAYLILKKFNSLKLFNQKLEFENDENKPPYVNIIFNVVKYHTFINDERESIFSEQMNYLEMKLNYAKNYDLKYYLILLTNKIKEKTEDELLKSDYYQNYANMVYRIYHELMLVFRMFLKENHMDDKTERNWTDYKKERTKYMLSKMNRELEFIFQPSFSPVTLKELNAMMKKDITAFIIECFNDIFETSRNISIEKNNNIEKLKQELNEIYKNYTKEEIDII